MSLKNVFRNLESTLKKVLVVPLGGVRSTYTPTSKSALVRQRIETRLAALTPELAPSVPFGVSGGYIGQAIAFGGYWRKFRVEVASFGAAQTGRGNSRAPFDIAITIEVGYPTEPEVSVTANGVTTVYDGSDLKSTDDEQIDRLMRGGDLLTNPSPIADAQVDSLESAFDLGNTVRRHRYVLRVARTYT